MNTTWNLDVFYTGLDDPRYEADIALLMTLNEEKAALVKDAATMSESALVSAILTHYEAYSAVLERLMGYLGLRQSVETGNGEIMAQHSRIMKLYTEAAASEVALDRLLGSIADIDALAADCEKAALYREYLQFNKQHCSHLLTNEEEAMIAAMNMTGGAAWGNLQSFLTSTVSVPYDGREITLPEVRNLAFHPDAAVRKAAYEAELACYDKIADSVAFSLNNIKNQVTMLCGRKGFASALDQALEQARMSRATLDAMMEAVREALPHFHKYLRTKGELLGHKNGLPWYELFAPIGDLNKEYSLEECRDYLVTCFQEVSGELADMIAEAFDNEWIDFYPRSGKQGGAFCADVTFAKQSRILTNYDGSFGAVDTLAHELGHAFHNRQMEDAAALNRSYPMPVAETASTFNEVHLGHYALEKADAANRLALLESDLKETCQCVVDIYSRYLFETAVFEQSQSRFLMAEDLKQLMLDCQKQAYGDGLDPQFLHPYMWVCKSHYYSSGLSFYNFPYTFGNLFAVGLYTRFQKEGPSFIDKYKSMLRLTGISTIEEDGAQLGIDLTKKDFWAESLASICAKIDEFCELAAKH